MRVRCVLVLAFVALAGCTHQSAPVAGLTMTFAPTAQDLRWSFFINNTGNESYAGAKLSIVVSPQSGGTKGTDSKTIDIPAHQSVTAVLAPIPAPGDAVYVITLADAKGAVLDREEGVYHQPCALFAKC